MTLNTLKEAVASRGYLVTYCLLSYLGYLSIMHLLFGARLPETEVLIALLGAPLLFQILPSFGMPFFALTHSLWTGFLLLSVMQMFLLDAGFRWGELSQPRLIMNCSFGALNLLGLVWLTFYSNINNERSKSTGSGL